MASERIFAFQHGKSYQVTSIKISDSVPMITFEYEGEMKTISDIRREEKHVYLFIFNFRLLSKYKLSSYVFI